mmetsp:Transcript_7020/g.19905  ORF Transcript_7020/g.19905 Transcript_7020/m.19905 type:complete len:186 (-) Transcript_7020:137-694(-)|eukprot:CAMPEP_0119140792 /NCGR_PEP_ID=MMETSP1310-20130426/29864_1 /TAXON_ID=464262 /ORGANISM="Genus nov. species nov., Strain RCC2339" /LENGTH=185 /DNA_ID=CAMNT_0007132181 /DNA_START=50 /DNA_END=607 /DNA_ORIENTATION=-
MATGGEEVLKEAEETKEIGNAYMKDKEYGKAMFEYHKAVLAVKPLCQARGGGIPGMEGLMGEEGAKDEATEKALEKERERAKAMLVVLYSNMAFACLKRERYDRAVTHASAAIAIDPKCVKARYRRALAIVEGNRGNLDEAKEDVSLILALQPTNATFKKLSDRLQARNKEYEETMKSRYQKMFA